VRPSERASLLVKTVSNWDWRVEREASRVSWKAEEMSGIWGGGRSKEDFKVEERSLKRVVLVSSRVSPRASN